MSGTFSGSPDVDGFPIAVVAPHPTIESEHAFVAGWTADGAPLFFHSYGGGEFDQVRNPTLATDSSQLALVTNIYGDVEIDGEAVRASDGQLVVLRLDPSTGAVLERQQRGGAASVQVASADAVDGAVMVTGRYSRTFTAGNVQLAPRGGEHDLFVCSLASSGGWCDGFGGSEAWEERAYRSVRSNDGHAWFAWLTDADSEFRDEVAGGRLSALDASGSLIAEYRWPYLQTTGLAPAVNSNDVFVAGSISPFGANQRGEPLLAGAARAIARIGSSGEVIWARDTGHTLFTDLQGTRDGSLLGVAVDYEYRHITVERICP